VSIQQKSGDLPLAKITFTQVLIGAFVSDAESPRGAVVPNAG
jgi:hypothetical protein